MAGDSLEKLLGLFNLSKKKEVERYCQDLVISSNDFASMLLAGRVTGLGPYRYACHFHQITPEHLHPKKEELSALGKNGVGPLQGSALKAMRKVNQLSRDRRMLAIHLFYTPSQKYWHLFYFDQRDYDNRKNHWKHGPHIHYSQDLFVKESLPEIWARATSEQPTFPPSIHVRYDHHRNQRSHL